MPWYSLNLCPPPQVLFASPPSSGAAVLRIKLAPSEAEHDAEAEEAAQPVTA